MCPNHVQCDIVPFSLTSEVVLPSYQHYLERQHHLKGAKVNESEALNQFGKTIIMLILARVSGYYSPYTAQAIKEEEDRCFFGSVFTHSEKKFFKHRLQNKFPKINNRSFIDLKWNTVVLSLKDLDLPMINILQGPRWKKTQVRKMFGSSNSY